MSKALKADEVLSEPVLKPSKIKRAPAAVSSTGFPKNRFTTLSGDYG